MNGKICCFLGHRKIDNADKIAAELYTVAEHLITDNNITTFLFGSKSQFDRLCHKVITELKERYPNIQRIYVRAEYQHIDDNYTDYLLESYEETYYSNKAIGGGKAVYVERNCEMIDKSDICIMYYKEDYQPPMRKNSKRDLFAYQPKSGTAIAYEYAKRKHKEIINLAT